MLEISYRGQGHNNSQAFGDILKETLYILLHTCICFFKIFFIKTKTPVPDEEIFKTSCTVNICVHNKANLKKLKSSWL